MTIRRRATSLGVLVMIASASITATALGASPSPIGTPASPSHSINGLAVDAQGRLYGADCYGARVFRFDATGPVVVAGSGSPISSGDGGPSTAAGLDCPFGPALDERGLFIVDHGNDSLRLVGTDGNISTFAGPGPFSSPIGIAIDTAGNIYVGDRDAHVVRKVDRGGVVTIIAGTGQPDFSGDGGPATAATLTAPEAIAVDAIGDVFVVDTNSQRILRIDPAGMMTTVAGNGVAGSTGDGGPATAATLDHPQEGLVVDAAGNLYVTEGQRIRRIDPQGIITTIAGTGTAGHTGDGGPATEAQLQDPAGLALDNRGVLYVSSDGNEPSCIRSIGVDGIINTLWCHP